jgi:hypothetical protein
MSLPPKKDKSKKESPRQDEMMELKDIMYHAITKGAPPNTSIISIIGMLEVLKEEFMENIRIAKAKGIAKNEDLF